MSLVLSMGKTHRAGRRISILLAAKLSEGGKLCVSLATTEQRDRECKHSNYRTDDQRISNILSRPLELHVFFFFLTTILFA